jgi:RHS repeat-associated protein
VNANKVIDLSKLVGEVAGSVGTTATGGVSYSIPIFVSPGTNDVKPNVALVYNSQSTDGIAGMGWNLSGMSIISRSGKNFYHHGKVQAVKYTNDDMFLLDGSKLNNIVGVNGGNGSTYAPESENFARITSYSNISPDNPDWFSVKANDGTTMEYGKTADSKLLTDDGTGIIYWRVNRMTDVNGNYVDFEYETINRECRIKQIKYTGNTATGLQPYNFVDFNYATRQDGNTVFESGASLASNSLLKSIKLTHIKDDGTSVVVRKYVLNHLFDNVRTKLTEVIEYAGEETAPSLNSTAFTYGAESANEVVNIVSHSLLSGYGSSQIDLYAGDFDANGKTDILAASYTIGSNSIKYYSGYKIYKANEFTGGNNLIYESTFGAIGLFSSNFGSNGLGGIFSSDFNKDGRDDVIYLAGNQASNTTHFEISKVVLKTTGSTNPNTNITSFGVQEFDYPSSGGLTYQLTNSNAKSFVVGDFDGDGNQDYILIAKNPFSNFHKAFFTSPSTDNINKEITNFGLGENSFAGDIATSDKIIPVDFDGDGKNELLIIKNNTSFILGFEKLSAATGLFMVASVLYTTTTVTKNCLTFPGDFNGDRKTDLLVHYSNNNWGLLYSNGKTYDENASAFYFQTPVGVTGIGIELAWYNNVLVADFNGDGKSDIMHASTTNAGVNTMGMYYSKGKNNNTFGYEVYNNTPSITNKPLTLGDFNGDGRIDIFAVFANDYAQCNFIKPKGQEKLLTNITTGHNVSTDFQYKLLTDKYSTPYIYNRTISLDDADNSNPYNYVQAPINVLYKTIVADGIGGENITEFSYENALVHRAAKGLLGFQKKVSKNNVTGITSISENAFDTDFALPYIVNETKKLTSNGLLIGETFYDNSFVDLSTNYFDKRYLQLINKTTSIDYVNGKAVESSNVFDVYGNITVNTNKVGFGYYGNITPTETVVTTTSYSIHNTNVPAKADHITITNTRSGNPSITKTNTFTYDNLGRLLTQTDFAGLPKANTNTVTYNSYGNTLTSIKSAVGMVPLINVNTYDLKGRFILRKQISGGVNSQTESFKIDTKWGVPISTTSTDCLVTNYEYDAFGRLSKTIFPNGNFVATTNVWNVWPFNSNNLFYIFEHNSGGAPPKIKHFDKWGRVYKTETYSMATATGAVDDELPKKHTILTTYDNRGNVKTVSNSFFPGFETPRYTTNNFDEYNRPLSTVSYRGTVSYAYSPQGSGTIKTTITNTDGNAKSQTTDAAGKKIAAIDNGGTLSFYYNSIGNQTKVRNNDVEVINSTYDVYGAQLTMTDINAGTTSYNYDNYNRIISQTDAKGNLTSFTYDDLGRTNSKVSTEGTISYEYFKDLATGCNNNNLQKVIGFNGITKTYTYDNLKRLSTVTETGVPGSVASRTTTYTYTINSALETTTYPNGVLIKNVYDVYGYLVKKTPSLGIKNPLFYNPVIDGEGRLVSYKLGNGKITTKTYDKDFLLTSYTLGVQNLSYNFQPSTGNLLQRADIFNNQVESFTYDNLNRLKTITTNGIAQAALSYDGSSTNSMGNIITKTDAGYYTYLNTKKHAVAFVTATPTSVQTPVTPTPASAINPATQNITYTSFLKAATITESGVTSDNAPAITFTYGPDYERIQTIFTQAGANAERRYFAGDYEEQEKGTDYNRSIVYVNIGDGTSAMVIKENGLETSYFTYTDHLGSILNVTDKTGTIIAAANYDAWGRERLPTNWNDYNIYGGLTSIAKPTWLYRGYTGHEMLPSFGLINMNGRMYDPVLGRMLSPDKFVIGANNTQGYNRYTYALNNPLIYTDPDGNHPVVAIVAVFAAVHLTADLIRHDFKMNFGEITGSVLTGALQGALSATGTGAITNVGVAFITAVASELPGINIPITDGFSLSLSPSFAYGGGGWSVGGSLGVHASIGNMEIGYGFGVGYGKNATTGITGAESRFSSMIGMRFGDVSLGMGQSNFSSGTTSQKTGMIYAGVGDFKIRYENDYLFKGSPAGDGGDRYRTTAATISYGEISMGLNLFTGAPDIDENGIRQTTKIGNGQFQYEEAGSKFRMGALYLGLSNTRVGVNTEGVRNYFQNQVAHKNGYTSRGGYPIFPVLGLTDKPYIQRQTRNPFTSW